jgi:hypothetical protein
MPSMSPEVTYAASHGWSRTVSVIQIPLAPRDQTDSQVLWKTDTLLCRIFERFVG